MSDEKTRAWGSSLSDAEGAEAVGSAEAAEAAEAADAAETADEAEVVGRFERVDAVIEALAREGTVGVEGTFTLESQRARALMQKSSLADPRGYVLELIQAAVLKGASSISISADANDLRVRFDGRPFTRRELERLYDFVHESTDDADQRACSELAVGISAALSLDPRRIRVCSADGEAGVELTVAPGESDRLEACAAREPGTSVHVRARFSPGLMKRVVENLAGRLPEEQLLREACRYAEIPVLLEGKNISIGLRLPDVASEVRLDAPDVRGAAGFRLSGGGSDEEKPGAMVHFVRNGVVVASHVLEVPTPGFIAVVEWRGLRLDLSRREVVRDAAYDEVICAVHGARRRSLEMLARAFNEAPQSFPDLDRIAALLRKASCEPAALVQGEASGEEALIRELVRARVWTVGPSAGEALNAVWGSSSSDVFAVGASGVILHFDGRSWHRMPSGTTSDLRGISGCAPDCVFIVGAGWIFMRYDGECFQRLFSPVESLNGVWCGGPGCVHLVGDRGTMRSYNGKDLSEHPVDFGLTQFHAAWGNAPNDVLVAGSGGKILHYDGQEWSYDHTGIEEDIASLWGTASGEAWAATTHGRVLERRGSAPQQYWAQASIATVLASTLPDAEKRWCFSFRGVWCSGREVFVVGDRGTIARRHDGAWTISQFDQHVDLIGVWGTSPEDVFAVGTEGTLLHFDGSTWGPVLTSIEAMLAAPAGSAVIGALRLDSAEEKALWSGLVVTAR